MGILQEQLQIFLKEFEPYSRRYFEHKFKSVKKFSPKIVHLYQRLADFSSGGKRLRAFLTYLGYKVGDGKNIQKILSISLGVELIHSFLLIHDDVIDNSEIRRSKPTIHKIYSKISGEHYGISQAIVLGDIACFEALDLINSSEFESGVKVAAIGNFLKVLRETGYGEALDVEYSHGRAKLDQVWQVADLKTARYSFVGPLSMGAIVGNVSDEQFSALEKFAVVCGTAFQLKDDLLGVFGEEKILGKPVISDLREGKNTILIYKSREMARLKERKILDRIWGKRDASFADLNLVRRIIKNSGAYEWCEKEQLKLVNKAKGEIAKITDKSDLRELFFEIADFVINREK